VAAELMAAAKLLVAAELGAHGPAARHLPGEKKILLGPKIFSVSA
jgi:hypothetical protein